jgi:LacI family transcriptional regulator
MIKATNLLDRGVNSEGNMPAPTIKDIAIRIGKSTTTVSRALHDYGDISAETKELVRRVAAEMGYTPNTLAQRLQKKQTDTLGLIMPTFGPRFSDPFFSEYIAGVGNKAATLGYDLLVSTHPPGPQELQAYRFNVQSHRVDGFILVRTRRNDPRVEYLCQVGFPFVAFGRIEVGNCFPWVDVDGERAMGLVVEHLAGLGHRRIACITAPDEMTFSHARLEGVQNKLQALGISLENDFMRTADLTQKQGFQAAHSLLSLPNPPTAIIAWNDLMAFGAMSAAQERGLVVGKDISITGFDNIPMAEHSHPPLTTISQPVYHIGNTVCEMLVELVRGRPLVQEQILLEAELVVRGSTGPAPGV